jgi:hypothetical protein
VRACIRRDGASGYTVSGSTGQELLREWTERLAQSRRANGSVNSPPSPVEATPRAYSAALDGLAAEGERSVSWGVPLRGLQSPRSSRPGTADVDAPLQSPRCVSCTSFATAIHIKRKTVAYVRDLLCISLQRLGCLLGAKNAHGIRHTSG